MSLRFDVPVFLFITASNISCLSVPCWSRSLSLRHFLLCLVQDKDAYLHHLNQSALAFLNRSIVYCKYTLRAMKACHFVSEYNYGVSWAIVTLFISETDMNTLRSIYSMATQQISAKSDNGWLRYFRSEFVNPTVLTVRLGAPI